MPPLPPKPKVRAIARQVVLGAALVSCKSGPDLVRIGPPPPPPLVACGFAGRIVSSDRLPISSATVRVLLHDREARLTTDEAGAFRLDQPARSATVDVVVEAEGHHAKRGTLRCDELATLVVHSAAPPWVVACGGGGVPAC